MIALNKSLPEKRANDANIANYLVRIEEEVEGLVRSEVTGLFALADVLRLQLDGKRKKGLRNVLNVAVEGKKKGNQRKR